MAEILHKPYSHIDRLADWLIKPRLPQKVNISFDDLNILPAMRRTLNHASEISSEFPLVLQLADDGVPADRRVFLCFQFSNLRGRQSEVIDLRVGLDARGGRALGQGDEALLQAPADQNLGLGLSVLLGQLLEDRLAPALAADQRAVSLGCDSALGTPLSDVVARAPRVDLPLANAQHATLALAAALGLKLGDVLFQLVQVVHAVVADTNGADLAGLDSLDELAGTSAL